jgi:hypothetical protein
VIVPELLSDNLFDVPEDIFSDRESDRDDSVRERKVVCLNKVTVKVKQASRKVTIVTMLQIWGQPCGDTKTKRLI